MALPFPANLNRFDPYKSYRFLVYFGNSATPVAGVSKVGELKRTSEPVEYKQGGDAIVRKGLGRTTYSEITLERGITHDPEFEAWANYSQALDHGVPSQSVLNLRKEVRIELLNEAGQPVMRYLVHRCWVSSFTALPSLDAGTNAVAIESIVLQNEGWERDPALSMPAEI
jgi:phage tail-like protein